jgi:hypothetical protein
LDAALELTIVIGLIEMPQGNGAPIFASSAAVDSPWIAGRRQDPALKGERLISAAY